MKTIIHTVTGREARRCHVRADHLSIKHEFIRFSQGQSQHSKHHRESRIDYDETGPGRASKSSPATAPTTEEPK